MNSTQPSLNPQVSGLPSETGAPVGVFHLGLSPHPSKDVLVRVDCVSKKFCRDLKKSLWYGMQDLGGELLGRGRDRDELRGRVGACLLTDNVDESSTLSVTNGSSTVEWPGLAMNIRHNAEQNKEVCYGTMSVH